VSKIDLNRLQEGLNTRKFGKKIIFLHEVDSTNDLAKKLANYGADEGTVVLAEKQSAGKGRLGRVWVSPHGGLYFSVILKPKMTASEAVKLVYVAGLAVAESLRDLYNLKVETKWPNDVLVNRRKACGILSEMSCVDEHLNFVILGIGVNVNFDVKKALPKALQKSVTSLQDVLGRKVEVEELFKKLLEKLENLYVLFLKGGFLQILKEWKKFASFLGCQVQVLSCGKKWVGIALDVEEDGSLSLEVEDGTVKHFLFGDVILRLD